MLVTCADPEATQHLGSTSYRYLYTAPKTDSKTTSRISYSNNSGSKGRLFRFLIFLCTFSSCSTLVLLLFMRSEGKQAVTAETHIPNLIQQKSETVLPTEEFIKGNTMNMTVGIEHRMTPQQSEFIQRQEHARIYCENTKSVCSGDQLNSELLISRHQKLLCDSNIRKSLSRKNWVYFKSKEKGNRKKQTSVSWCPIFKAASTPWLALFAKLSGILTSHTEGKVKSGKLNFMSLFKDFHLNAPPRDDQSENYKMVIVRHPFDRLLSAYRDKLERIQGREYYHTKYGTIIAEQTRYSNIFKNEFIDLPPSRRFHPMLSRILDGRKFKETSKNNTSSLLPRLYQPPTFPEFVQYLLRTEPRAMDEHWRPMYLECSPCMNHFNLILKVETMTADREAVLDLLGYKNSSIISELNQVWRSWTNEAKFPVIKDKIVHYFSQIKKADLRKLYSIYEPDFQLFNYTADKYIDVGL